MKANGNGKKNGKRLLFNSKPRNRASRFKKLRALKCFDEVHRRILQGWQLPALARYIQEEEKEYLEISFESLVCALKDYRESIPPGELIQERMPQVFEKAAVEVQQGLDELTELEELYRTQRKRIDIDFALERSMGKLFPSMTQEMRTAREILSTIAELKMDLGLANRRLGTVDIDAHITAHVEGRYSNPRLAAVLANPEKRQRLLGIAKQLAVRADRNVIEAVEVPADPEPEPAV